MLAHLIVGSEGTLAFVAEVTFRTVPVLSHAATGLLVFDSLSRAAGALPALIETGPVAVELLDAASLRVAQRDAQAGDELRRIDVARHAALLVEYRAESAAALAATQESADRLVSSLPLAAPAEFTVDRRERARLWHVRKNLYAAVAADRPTGTNALLEDVAVPAPNLLATCDGLVALFAEHGYDNSAIFGHARDGNLHFTLIERFDEPSCLERYQRFTDGLVDLVLGQGGSLKAEHGTGRMMSPYVRRQYGDELYDVMWELKRLFDPAGILNPGVVLSDDETAHLRHLKVTPASDPEVDRCVECGYCEPVCPSRDLTTTPRQRIVLRREWARAKLAGEAQVARELERAFDYDVVDTCAVDAMCQTACPVLINTGDLVKRLRVQRHGLLERGAWRLAARHWAGATRMAAAALTVAKKLPSPLVSSSLGLARTLLGPESMPMWSADLPRGGYPRPTAPTRMRPAAVFFPSCLGQLFAPAPGALGASGAFLEICRRAGTSVMTPAGVGGLCCGTPWASKGLVAGYQQMRDKTLSALLEATGDAGTPVVCDASSCTEGLRHIAEANGAEPPLRVVDVVDYLAEELLPRLTIRRRLASLSLHPTCASTRLGSNDALLTVAHAIADEVVVAADWGCCGFAGDRGLLRPELTAAATSAESAAIRERRFDAYASCNRTCEIGMTRATGREHQHIIELVELLSRP
jgi:D-lactate dehydrogenase